MEAEMPTPRQILVIDDDESIRALVTLALSVEGYEVMSALNGVAALDWLATSRPAAILLDMRMPIMNGWEFARAYAQLPGPRAPLIIMSAARDAATYAAEVKADACLAKPFDLEDLYACIARFARGR
jgi:two-component system, chemotaxis family, chemotaxis protein CheY